MKKWKRSILWIISLVTIFVGVSVGVYAYYTVQDSKYVSAGTAIESATKNVVEISTYDQFFSNSKSSKHNDGAVSESRKILKLTANITLLDDLVITNDVHIDLNGKTLNLANHVLTIEHSYAGSFSIYGGTIEVGSGTGGLLVVNLPNAGFVNDATFTKNSVTESDKTVYTKVVASNEKYTAYSAFYMIADVLSSSLNLRPDFDGFATVSDAGYDITSVSHYLNAVSCEYNGDTAHAACSFVYKDLALPKNYLASDITISYSSSNTNVLSNNGDVTLPNSKKENVTLTVTVNKTGWESSHSVAFKLHVVDLSDTTVRDEVALSVIKAMLAPYQINTAKQVTDTLTVPAGYYDLNHGIELPKSIFDGNITYSYAAYDEKVEASASPISTSSYESGNTYVFEPNDSCFHLKITMNNHATYYPWMYSTYVGSKETVVRLILNNIYGGSIFYGSTLEYYQLKSFADLSANDSAVKSYITDYGITAVSYALVANADDTRDILDASSYFIYTSATNRLTVDAEQAVDKGKYSALAATFTFTKDGADTDVTVNLNIEYVIGNEDNVNGFMPYYTLFKNNVRSSEATFSMPFCYNGGAPYVIYDFASTYEKHDLKDPTNTVLFSYYTYTIGAPSSLKLCLCYDNAVKATFKYSGSTSLSSQFDTWLTQNSLTLAVLATKTNVHWEVSVDAQYAQENDINLLLIYNYRFKSATSWTVYQNNYMNKTYTSLNGTYMAESTCSTFTHTGGLFYNASGAASNCINDINFFVWIYNTYKTTGTSFASTSDTAIPNTVIPRSWLSQDIALDVTSGNEFLAATTNFKGLGYLTGVTKVNLSGKNISSIISTVASMTSVKELILRDCSLTTVTAIKDMTWVKKLDISSNDISYFSELLSMTGLEEVILHSNKDHDYLGSKGVCNYQTYTDLMRNGAIVYNIYSDGVAMPYADSNDPTAYMKLKSIIYQDKLKSGESITKLYQNLPTSGSAYGLSSTVTFGYTGDATTATYFTATVTDGGYTITVKYYVDRY